ncbi:hypothetical protein [Methanobrevibacter sp.]|uniref:hypothetical protein n=1 Tax=Methanobrevibacter sp. TaxID=66852 RepID=UPI00386CC778
MLSRKEKAVLKETNLRNKLRYDIKMKKRELAKIIQHPEMLEETLILKAEIETLELELHCSEVDSKNQLE